MCSISIKRLGFSDVQASRELVALYPDLHAQYVVERLPAFFSIAHFLDPLRNYAARQKLILGAYSSQELVGTVAVQTAEDLSEQILREDQWTVFFSRFTQHDLDVYSELSSALMKTYIGAPSGSLTLHSLTVASEHRRRGIGRKLVETLLRELDSRDHEALYVETARGANLARLFEAVGFRSVRKTFSFSQRLEFGCWGSNLLKYVAEQ